MKGLYHFDMGPGVEAFSTEREAVLPFPVVQAHQVHQDRVARIYMDGTDLKAVKIGDPSSAGPCWGTVETGKDRDIPSPLIGVDALVTDVPGIAVGARTADCIPVLLHDPVRHVVAAAHAGWRGTVARIPSKALDAMKECYGTDPSDVVAVIGPGIGPESFQVGREVADAFESAGFDLACIMHDEGPVQVIPDTSELRSMRGGLHIDLWLANRMTLVEAGVPLSNISVAGIDTFTAADRFYSARRETIACPRIINVIKLDNG